MNDDGRFLLQHFKESVLLGEPVMSLMVGDPPIAYLRPVSIDNSQTNINDVTVLTEGRNLYRHSFLTEFKATNEQTSEWLKNAVLPDSSRILFMLDTMSGRTIGYMGLAYINWEKNYGEADAIVKIMGAEKGLMTMALKTMIEWARKELGLREIGVRVLSDNPAIEFYRKCGFKITKKVPLSKQNKQKKIIWYEDHDNGNPERFLVYHLYE